MAPNLDFSTFESRKKNSLVGYAVYLSDQTKVVMHTFPNELLAVIVTFQPLFSKRVFMHAHLLLAGAILTPAKRTISSVLRIMVLGEEKNFHKYHRLLSTAQWSARKAAQLLLKQLLDCFLPEGDVVLGIDETLERLG